MASTSANVNSYEDRRVGDLSANRALLVKAITVPAIVCATMLAVSAVMCGLSHVDMMRLFFPYLSISFGVTIAGVLVSIFCWVAAMARVRADAPLRTVFERLRGRALLLLLPFVILPCFLAGYTAAKTATPFLVGFGWDGFWARADRLIFGDDAWRIAQRLLGLRLMPMYAWFYTVVWGGTFMGATALVAINAKPQRVGVFYTAMLLTWLVGGWLAAMMFSAAGPVFTHLFDPVLGRHFAGISAAIAGGLPADNSLRLTQKYLAASVNAHTAFKGGGISAMPSMHLGAASIYIFAARGTKWLIPAVLFWLTIFVLSGYFGYHYWVDGLAAAGIAWVCWCASELVFRSFGEGTPMREGLFTSR
jgi:PAP2 superfamily